MNAKDKYCRSCPKQALCIIDDAGAIAPLIPGCPACDELRQEKDQ